MQLELAKLIADTAQQADLPVQLRESYSGRGMYGESTAALIAPDFATIAAAAIYAVGWADRDEWQVDDLADAVRQLRQDSMGHDTVVY